MFTYFKISVSLSCEVYYIVLTIMVGFISRRTRDVAWTSAAVFSFSRYLWNTYYVQSAVLEPGQIQKITGPCFTF